MTLPFCVRNHLPLQSSVLTECLEGTAPFPYLARADEIWSGSFLFLSAFFACHIGMHLMHISQLYKYQHYDKSPTLYYNLLGHLGQHSCPQVKTQVQLDSTLGTTLEMFPCTAAVNMSKRNAQVFVTKTIL